MPWENIYRFWLKVTSEPWLSLPYFQQFMAGNLCIHHIKYYLEEICVLAAQYLQWCLLRLGDKSRLFWIHTVYKMFVVTAKIQSTLIVHFNSTEEQSMDDNEWKLVCCCMCFLLALSMIIYLIIVIYTLLDFRFLVYWPIFIHTDNITNCLKLPLL